MKTCFGMLFAGGLVGAFYGCSSSDDTTTPPAIVDAGTVDASPTPPAPGDDDDLDSGLCTTPSALTACICSAQGSQNADKPVCGCPGVTGQVGAGVTLTSKGAQFSCGVVDGTGGRLVMGAASIQGGSIWTVDLKTGNRTLLTGTVNDPVTGPQTIATGDAMLTPAAIRLGTDGWYVLEGTTASKKLQRVDPATGTRTTLLTTDQMTSVIDGGHPITCTGGPVMDTSFANPAAGMGLGPANEVYLAMGKSPGYVAITKVTLSAAPTCTIVSGDNYGLPASNPVGSGPNLEAISSVDFANGAIFAFDALEENLVKIDPGTGARTNVSSPKEDAGAGTCFTASAGGANVFAFTGTTAWTDTNATGEYLTSIDLTTGTRTCVPVKVPCHPAATNAQAIDRTVGVYVSPTPALILTAGSTTIWALDTTNQVANVLSE